MKMQQTTNDKNMEELKSECRGWLADKLYEKHKDIGTGWSDTHDLVWFHKFVISVFSNLNEQLNSERSPMEFTHLYKYIDDHKNDETIFPNDMPIPDQPIPCFYYYYANAEIKEIYMDIRSQFEAIYAK
jgi:hypothetical protein